MSSLFSKNALALFAACASLAIPLVADASERAPKPTLPAETFAGRPEARLSFESDIRGWRAQREGNDDILYVEGRNRQWYRAELACFGRLSDADFAYALVTENYGLGFERHSRVRFIDAGVSVMAPTSCLVDSMVALTLDEAVTLQLRPAPRNSGNGTGNAAPTATPPTR